MSDLHCPYCDAGNEVCHDDGFGYAEDKLHEMQCCKCDKNFVFATSIHFYYSPEKADCLNTDDDGKPIPHDLERVSCYPDLWPNWKRCKNCDYETSRYEDKP